MPDTKEAEQSLFLWPFSPIRDSKKSELFPLKHIKPRNVTPSPLPFHPENSQVTVVLTFKLEERETGKNLKRTGLNPHTLVY